MSVAFWSMLGHAIGAVALGWHYFRRYRIAPPLGVLDRGDIAVMTGGIVLVPFGYLLLPRWIAVALLAVAALSLLHTIGEPVLHYSCWRWRRGPERATRQYLQAEPVGW